MAALDPSTLATLRASVWPALEDGMGLPRGILNAVATYETRGAFSDLVSRAGARGIFQLTPVALQQVRQDYGLDADPSNPYSSSAAAAALLARYARIFSAQPSLMLAAYNAGEGTIKRFIRSVAAQGSARLPRETVDYVANTLALLP